jgi:hypothetical protein
MNKRHIIKTYVTVCLQHIFLRRWPANLAIVKRILASAQEPIELIQWHKVRIGGGTPFATDDL